MMARLDTRVLLKTIADDTCLHCRLNALVKLHYIEHGERQDGLALIGVQDALEAIAQVAGELIAAHPEAKGRAKFAADFATDTRASIDHILSHSGRDHPDVAWPQ